MNWVKVNKTHSNQPSEGCYKDDSWKTQIANECNHRCVYCGLPETNSGGLINYHVEHYRPKSKFKHLINDINNLFWACSVCNCFKKEDWPNEPTPALDTVCYPDPSIHDYNGLFDSSVNFTITGRNVASKYIENRLYLNRPQLILLRRLSHLLKEIENRKNLIREHIDKNNSVAHELLLETYKILDDISTTLLKYNTALDYKITEIRRVKN